MSFTQEEVIVKHCNVYSMIEENKDFLELRLRIKIHSIKYRIRNIGNYFKEHMLEFLKLESNCFFGDTE